MRNFIFFLALITAASGSKKKQDILYSSLNFKLVELSEGVYGCVHQIGGKAICNAGVIDNGKETLIFDTFLSPGVAQELVEVIDGLGLSPIKYVVNSHCHNDHIRGNQVFAPEVKIISTSRTAELIKEREPVEIENEEEYAPQAFAHYDSLYHAYTGDTTTREYLDILMWRPYYETLAESHSTVQTRIPDLFVDDQQDFNGPDRRVRIIAKGPGHSESDLILFLPDDKILFSGDLVFNMCHPFIADGSIPGWKNWLDFLDSLDADVVVPGHGEIGSKEVITGMKEYFHTIENLVEEMHNRGLTAEDAGIIEIPDPYKDWWFEQFFPSNMRFVYNQLNEE